MLFDPNYAIPAAIDVLPPECGLIVTLEDHRTEESKGGRKSKVIADWSVEKSAGWAVMQLKFWHGIGQTHQPMFSHIKRRSCARSVKSVVAMT